MTKSTSPNPEKMKNQDPTNNISKPVHYKSISPSLHDPPDRQQGQALDSLGVEEHIEGDSDAYMTPEAAMQGIIGRLVPIPIDFDLTVQVSGTGANAEAMEGLETQAMF